MNRSTFIRILAVAAMMAVIAGPDRVRPAYARVRPTNAPVSSTVRPLYSSVRVETQSQSAAAAGSAPATSSGAQAVLKRYCTTCHNGEMRRGGLLLDQVDVARPGRDPQTWEKVVRKVRTGMMPPSGAPRPDRATLDRLAAVVEDALDHAAAGVPNPGAPVLHRLNRTEYANAVRDLLDLPVDAAALLP